MTQANLLDLAKQGDPQAIADLMNRSLQPRGMTAVVDVHGSCLEVILEATQIPNRQVMTAFVENGIKNLGVTTIQTIKVLGQQSGSISPSWTQEIEVGGSSSYAAPSIESVVTPGETSQAPSLQTTPPPVAPFRPANAPEESPIETVRPIEALEDRTGNELETDLEMLQVTPESTEVDLLADLSLANGSDDFSSKSDFSGELADNSLPDLESGIGFLEPSASETVSPAEPVVSDSDWFADDVPVDQVDANNLGMIDFLNLSSGTETTGSEATFEQDWSLDLSTESSATEPPEDDWLFDLTTEPAKTSVSEENWSLDLTAEEMSTPLLADETDLLGSNTETEWSLDFPDTASEPSLPDLPLSLDDEDQTEDLTAPATTSEELSDQFLSTEELPAEEWSLDLPGTELSTDTASSTPESDWLFDLPESPEAVAPPAVEDEWSFETDNADLQGSTAPLEDWGLDSLELPDEAPVTPTKDDWLSEQSQSEPAPAVTFEDVNWSFGESEAELPATPLTAINEAETDEWSLDESVTPPIESSSEESSSDEDWGLDLTSSSESQWGSADLLGDQGETWLLDDSMTSPLEAASESDTTDEWGLDLETSEASPLSEAIAPDLQNDWSLDLPETTPLETSMPAEEEWSLDLTDEPILSAPSTPADEEWSFDLSEETAAGEAPVVSEEDWALDLGEDSGIVEAPISSETSSEEWVLDLTEESMVSETSIVSEQDWSLDLGEGSGIGEASISSEAASEEWVLDLPEESVVSEAPLVSEEDWTLDLDEDAGLGEVPSEFEAASGEEWTLDLSEESTLSEEVASPMPLASEEDWTLDLPEEDLAVSEIAIVSQEDWSHNLNEEPGIHEVSFPETISEDEWTLDLPEAPLAGEAPIVSREDWSLDLADETATPELPHFTEEDWALELPDQSVIAASSAATEDEWVLDLPEDTVVESPSQEVEDWSLAAVDDETAPVMADDDSEWSLIDIATPALSEPTEEDWSLDVDAIASPEAEPIAVSDITMVSVDWSVDEEDNTSALADTVWSIDEEDDTSVLADTTSEVGVYPAIDFDGELEPVTEVTEEIATEPELDLSLGDEWLRETDESEDWSVPSEAEELPPDLASVEEPEQRWLDLPDEAIAPVPPAVSEYTLQPQVSEIEERVPLSFAAPEDNLELGDFDVVPTPEVEESEEVEPAAVPLDVNRKAETSGRSGGFLYYVVLVGLIGWMVGLVSFSVASHITNPTPEPQPTVAPQSRGLNFFLGS